MRGRHYRCLISASLDNKLQSDWMKQTEPRSLIVTRVRDQGPDTRSFDLLPVVAEQLQGDTFIPGQDAMREVTAEEHDYFAFTISREEYECENLTSRDY